MPKRGDRVAPPPGPGEWDLRYGDSGAVDGWEQVVVKAGLGVLGIIVAVATVWSGITWAIPPLGLFGVAWTGVILILAANAWRFVVRWRR